MEKVVLLVYDPSSVKLDLKELRVVPTPEGLCSIKLNGTTQTYKIPREQYDRGKRHFLCITGWTSSVDESVLNSKPPELSPELLSRIVDESLLRSVTTMSYTWSRVAGYWRDALLELLVCIPRRITR